MPLPHIDDVRFANPNFFSIGKAAAEEFHIFLDADLEPVMLVTSKYRTYPLYSISEDAILSFKRHISKDE